MLDFRITVVEVLSCPAGTTLSPDGRTLAPWITYEADEDRYLTCDELLQLGLDPGLNLDRTIELLED